MARPPRFSWSSKRVTPAELGAQHKAHQEKLKQDAADRREAAVARKPRPSRTRRRG